MPRPRVLCVADVWPWPARDGYRLRLGHVVKALAHAGSLDLFAAVRGDPAGLTVPDGVALERFRVSAAPGRPVNGALAARTLAGSLPRRVMWRDWERARRELREWAADRYDVVWYSHADSLAGLGPVGAHASVLDTDNLEDMRLRSLRAAHLRGLRHALAPARPSAELARELRYRLVGALGTFDAGRWTRLQHRLATQVDATVVCSELDRRRIGAPNAVVIPNGYEAPPPRSNGAPTQIMSMVGLFHYGPNSDGARFFVEEVMPRVSARAPHASVRFIGRHDGHLGDLAHRPGVTLTGEVDDVTRELADARLAIVPLRAGSGTRLKVLEAFACGVPVVSTSLGCEGLDVVPGQHLLVADRPGEFADACVALLSDDELHRRIRAEAHRLYESHYRWEDIRQRIAELIASLDRDHG